MANDIIGIVVTDNSDNVQINATPNLVSINVSNTSGNIIGSNYYLSSSYGALPVVGDTTTLYVTNDTSLMYRWNGLSYTQVNSVTSWGTIAGTLSSQTDLQSALNAKAPLASPTFTGTVSGITKAMVGLGNVDNTTDLLKPISTATQSALNLKYDASNPSGYTNNTGTVTSVGGTGTVSGLSLSGSVTTSGNLTLGGTLSLTSGNVTTALGYTPYNATNPSGYISGITSGNVTTALGFTPENAAKKGVANGYASLDGGGLVPASQLPSYVDDVLEYTNLASFPATGETGKIYVDLATNKIYRWSGTTYIEVSPSVGTIWGGITGTLSNQTDLQNALNAKQATLSGTGFVKSTAGTISYDTNTYLTTSSATTTYVPYTGASGNVNLGTNNISANNFLNAFSNITASGTQVVLTVASEPEIVVNGSGGQTIKLPDATTLANGASFLFNNNQSSGAITVNNNSNTLVVSVPSGGYCEVMLIDNSTAAGSYDRHFHAPANVSWSTNTFDYAGSVTSATWNGVTVATNRGGTGQSTYTDGQLLIGNTSGNTLSKATLSAGTGITVTNGNGSISIATTITQYTDALARASLSFTAGSGAYNSTTGVITIPTNTSQLTNGANYITLTSLSATSPIVYTNTTGVISIPVATTSVNGYLSSTDWTTFNNKANALSGTTNAVAKFTSSTAIGNSNITDTGSLVTIASPLTLSGAATGTGNISNYTVTASSGSAISKKITSTLVASANSDTLIGLDIAPTFTNGSFTGVSNYAARFNSSIHLLNGGITTTNGGWFGWGIDNTTRFVGSAALGINAYVNSVKYFQLSPTTGNFILANGGTFTDAGYRLDVAGTTRFQGTTASDTAPLGSELAGVTGTGTNWALATSATNLNVGGYTHTVGSTAALTTSLAAVNGTYYQITYTITGRTAGSITIAYGGTSTNINSSGYTGPLASSTGVLTITPTTDFDGTLVLSIKSIGTSSASSTFANSAGTSNIEVRASSTTSNTFIGLNAGTRYTTGDGGTAIGTQALQNNTTGQSNTAVGYLAMQLNTTGNNNAAFGLWALLNNTTGYSNSAFGQSAGWKNTTGVNNTFIGNAAGQQNTTASSNTFIGQSAGQANTTASNNSFVGTSAGTSNTTGYQNVAFGQGALQSNTTGYYNVAIGQIALQNNLTGAGNIAIGQQAGRYISGGSTANTISNNSIYIGTNTKALADNQTNQIVIGDAVTGLGSNTTVLGNSSTATTAIYGNLLLGSTTDAGYKLDVTGTARVTTSAYFATASGSVGIGTTSPVGKLDIQETATNTYGIISLRGNNRGSEIDFYQNSTLCNTIYSDGTTNNLIFATGTGITERMRITSAGNVEIKNQLTLTSYFNLIGGSSNANRYSYIYTSDTTLGIYAASGGGEVKDLELRSSGSATGGNITLKTNGNTLIGTYTDNGYKLNVNGQPGANGYTLWTNYSDKRLKENIQPLVNNTILDKINLLNPVTFNYNEASGYDKETRARKVSGFIAQELKEIFPEMVGTLKLNDEEYFDTNLSNLSLYLVKAIQELSAEITILKNK